MSKLTLRAQTVDIAYLPLRQDLLAKSVLMTAKSDFGLGNNPLKSVQIQGIFRHSVGVHRFRVHPCPTDGRRGSGFPGEIEIQGCFSFVNLH
jgi:hypothetical protein